ncbi:hypothetical protein PybrP1_004183 [[Pythium] brassicae (nom. inval.)]|nr:hypothetical protein PybrP1_004183 [[Pythium] brassicae (nom. inval.)]
MHQKPTTSALSPPRAPSEQDAPPLPAEGELLEEFYSLMYESAVLVGVSSSSLGKGSSSDASASSPRRGGGASPRKNLLVGPTATNLSAATGATTTTFGSPSPLLTREIMNAMLPPKTWTDAAGKWQRMVKLTQAPRGDAMRLESVLDRLLVTHQARATAICHVREKFFLQVFEGIIREATCECPERGLVLLRVRDELRLSIEAYQTLYHNSISYGRKKAVQAEAGTAELEAEVQRLERRRDELRAMKHELAHNERFLSERLGEERRKRHARQETTREFLQIQRVELETFLKELKQDK